MNGESLRELLARLHERLQDAPSLDAKSRDLLRTVMTDIEHALEKNETAGARAHVRAYADVSPAHDAGRESPGTLEELAVSFEAEHPSLARTLRQLIDALQKAGI